MESTPLQINRPLIVHLIYRLGTGGLERVLSDCVAGLTHYRHVVISLTDKTEFSQRLPVDVQVFEIGKKPGKDLAHYLRLWRLLRRLRPALVHTYNIATLEYQMVARLAGVFRGVHAEHGRDIYDTDGTHGRYNRLRRWLKPWVSKFVPVSEDLAQWLRRDLGFEAAKVVRIYNGIDVNHYRPSANSDSGAGLVICSVARLSEIKDQVTLLKAFSMLLEKNPGRVSLVLVGGGPLRASLERLSVELGLGDAMTFAGEQSDVLPYLQACDVFSLSSIAEGIPMTVLEAMACAKTIVATRVGGIPELVTEGENGSLVDSQNAAALADAWQQYLDAPQKCAEQGFVGREKVCKDFSLQRMLDDYERLYQEVLA